ncbi:MAG TPA: CDP-diacylglycerol--serine O-phosphatidyltransferase [Candidatus Methylomirabilis sp.]|nr:CDP-diacylglycerol--serine O-phosphatidyltransferase [Candidatus Methylomirabilis sp.]
MRRGRRRGVYLLPSLLTIGNLLCGVYAIVAVYNNDYTRSAAAILVALVLDGLDGAVARLTNSQSDFGVQLDSLADLVSFGVAPAILSYAWAIKPFSQIGWLFGSIIPTALFVSTGAFRLARFNVQTRNLDKRYFVGLPIPAAAAVIASFVLFIRESDSLVAFHHELLSHRLTSALVVVTVYALSFLMVSRLRYRSLKGFEIQKRQPFTLLIGLTLVVLVIAAEPSLLVFSFFFCYALSGIVRSIPLFRRRVPGPLEQTAGREGST